jgi:hypothetical protein
LSCAAVIGEPSVKIAALSESFARVVAALEQTTGIALHVLECRLSAHTADVLGPR